MSKSKGEFLTIDLIKSKGYSPLDYKFFCLNSHYRNSLVFSYESLDGAKNAFNKLKSRIASITEDGDVDIAIVESYIEKFSDAFKNDINTSLMITVLYDILKDNAANGSTKRFIINEFDNVLSLDLLKEDIKEVDSSLEEEIIAKIEERKEAKKNKDFAKADAIRDELLARGIKLIDTTYEIL